jgi:SAM-dependent methyltransferase
MSDVITISPARGFAAEHAHYLDDAGFWRAHAERLGGPVLDLGAAAGRIAVEVAAVGVDVFALDADPEMLQVLRERADAAGVAAHITTIEGRMEDADLPSGIALAIVPMNTLQVLVDAGARTRTFARVAQTLRPGGEFIFDLSVPDLDDISDWLGDVIPTGSHHDPDTGAVLVHTAVYDALDPVTRTLDFRVIVDRTLPDGVQAHDERHHHVHLYTPDEVRALATNAGLEIMAVDGGFSAEPFDPRQSERQVWRCRRPEAAR